MTERKRVVCFGELLIRLASPGHETLLQSPQLHVHVGGAEANVAVSLARFGNDAAMVSVVPANTLGEAALGDLRRHGVDTDGIRSAAGRMGLYFLTQGAGQRQSEVLYDRAGSAFAEADPGTIDWARALDGAAWLHVSGVTLAIGKRPAAACVRAVEAAVLSKIGVSFDGNYRASLWADRQQDGADIVRGVLAHADIAFVNDRDIALTLGLRFPEPNPQQRCRSACRAAFDAFPNLRAIYSTLRHARRADCHDFSAAMFTRTGELCSRAYVLQGIVDRIGAGDAFAAGVLHGVLAGQPARETLEFATAAAALKHSIPGDFNLVRIGDVLRLLDAQALDIKR